MASAAQAIANRANALHSTGPRTEQGKRASSTNALTSGLTASKFFIRPDEQLEFDQFKSALQTELKPDGTLQSILFDRVLHAAWNLRRCDELEYKVQQEAHAKNLDDALADDELARKLDRIYRYKKMHESSQRRATSDLRQLQTEALWRRANKEPAKVSVLAGTAQITARLGRLNAVDQKANLDFLRQHIEAYIAPPPLDPNRRSYVGTPPGAR